jgi:hypothetical protein
MCLNPSLLVLFPLLFVLVFLMFPLGFISSLPQLACEKGFDVVVAVMNKTGSWMERFLRPILFQDRNKGHTFINNAQNSIS